MVVAVAQTLVLSLDSRPCLDIHAHTNTQHMSFLICFPGMALATAMAISGTVILIALCRHNKPLPAVAHLAATARHRNSPSTLCNLRSCISSEERKREREAKGKKKKRVHFAEEVAVALEADGNSWVEELELAGASPAEEMRGVRQMPANRIALYNGILQDRLQRMACSY